MAIYDEKTHILIEKPDLEKGYLYPGKLLISDSENSTELEGTDGLRTYSSEPVYEDCQFYHEYTAEEMPLNLLQTSYSIQQTSPSLSYKITTVYLNDYDAEGPDYTICFGTWGSYGIEQIQVVRGSGWEDLTIKATFNVKGERTVVLVPETGIINVPPEATRYPLDAKKPGYIVFTGVSNGVQRNSKNLMYLVYGHAEADLMNSQVTPSEWEQFVTQVEAYVDASEARVKQYAANAKASENAAAESANKAKEEAQKALGFRSLYSAVLPKDDGDLDPSRPIESKTASSVTVKSLGDRLESVKVNGFTQDGASAGLRMVELELDSSLAWMAITSKNLYFDAVITIPPNSGTNTEEARKYQYCTIAQIANADAIADLEASVAWVYYDGPRMAIRVRFSRITTVEELKIFLDSKKESGDPVKIWYAPADASQATGLYIPIQAQGHEYRCEMLELTEALGTGDNVQSNVPSGCDKKIVFDASNLQGWSQADTYDPEKYRYIYKLPDALSADASEKYKRNAYSDAFKVLVDGKTYYLEKGFTINADLKNLYFYDEGESLSEWKEKVSSNPITLFYKSVNYAGNDLPVSLETHANGAVYAHQAVELAAVPYTEADVAAANQLANTPSTLPYIEDADVPMLLNESDATQTTESVAPLASALPVAGTYIVSSQEGTTVQVSLKAMQDGGNAKTLCGKSIDDLNNESIGWLGSMGVVGSKIGDPPFDVIKFNVASCNNSDVLVVCLASNTGMRTINLAMARELGTSCVLTCKSDNAAYEDTVLCAKVYTDRIEITSVVSGNTDDSFCMAAEVYKLGGIKPV